MGLAQLYIRGLDTGIGLEYEGVSGEEEFVRNKSVFDTESTWCGSIVVQKRDEREQRVGDPSVDEEMPK